MIDVHAALREIARRRGDAVVISTMTTGREWPEFSTNEQLDFPLSGCMGKASSLGLGVALARPDKRVIVFDGDGSLLMNLGTLVTIANAKPKNLVHCAFENGIYEITGGQPVPGEGTFNLATMARGAGYANVYEFGDEGSFKAGIDEALSKDGPTFIVLRVGAVDKPSQIKRRPTKVAFRELREALASTS
jgi:phosphonopyruvate decarboxylase